MTLKNISLFDRVAIRLRMSQHEYRYAFYSPKNMDAEVFGFRLKEILDVLQMSQRELSIRSGLTPAAVSQIVNGKREPSLGTIVAILKVIPIKFEKLVEERF